jgi:hypothetical protein
MIRENILQFFGHKELKLVVDTKFESSDEEIWVEQEEKTEKEEKEKPSFLW